jgi:hypothetical protein
MNNTESTRRFVEFGISVKFWAISPPDVATARPPRCPICEAPGQDAEGRVLLHGHGLRERRARGPVEADGEIMEVMLLLRRYACQRCRAVITVGPRGLLPRRRYTAAAVGLALWLWAVWLWTDPAVRTKVCTVESEGVSRPERWTTLRRWARAARDGELWSSPVTGPGWTLRDGAERVARWLYSLGDPLAPSDEHRVVSGAAHAR